MHAFDELSMLCPSPLPEAVALGLFGQCEQGSMRPNPEQIAVIIEHQAQQLVELLVRVAEISGSHSDASNPDEWQDLERQKEVLHATYQRMLTVHTEQFGADSAGRLDRYARHLAGVVNGL